MRKRYIFSLAALLLAALAVLCASQQAKDLEASRSTGIAATSAPTPNSNSVPAEPAKSATPMVSGSATETNAVSPIAGNPLPSSSTQINTTAPVAAAPTKDSVSNSAEASAGSAPTVSNGVSEAPKLASQDSSSRPANGPTSSSASSATDTQFGGPTVVNPRCPRTASAAETVCFRFDSARLTAKSKELLTRFAAQIKAGNKTIELNGFTDAIGTRSYNEGLAQRRNQAVADFLASQGVEIQKISNKVGGKEGNSSLMKHRRVDIRILQ